MRSPSLATSLRYRARRLRTNIGILLGVEPPRRSPTGIARRNDLLAIRAIAERRPRASSWAVDVVLLEMLEHGASVSIAEAEQIARRVMTAASYKPACGGLKADGAH